MYLALPRPEVRWKSPPNRKLALAHFAIIFADRFPA